MYCLKNPNRRTKPVICNNCKRKCERAGKRQAKAKRNAAR